jgi:hypothetical protein
MNNIHSLIWHWTTFILSFDIEQQLLTHLALNNIHWVSNCCSMSNERMNVVQCQMREWMLFKAKWDNECSSMPNERMKVVQCQMSEWMLFNAKWVNECYLMPEQHSFSHLALNNIHSLIWHWTTFILSFDIEQQLLTHLALNNIHSLIWHWTTITHSFDTQCQMREWMLFNAKWENESCSMPNERMNVVQCQMSE